MVTDSGIKAQIAEVFRLLRVHHGMKQVDLAKGMGVNPQYISQLEHGRKSVTLNTIQKYSNYFGIRFSSIIDVAERLPVSPVADIILDIKRAKAKLKNEREQ